MPKNGKKSSKLFCEIQNWTFLKCPFSVSQNFFENKKKIFFFDNLIFISIKGLNNKNTKNAIF